jgi:hypothetical protein
MCNLDVSRMFDIIVDDDDDDDMFPMIKNCETIHALFVLLFVIMTRKTI